MIIILLQCVFVALLAVAFALPTADPKPEAKPEPDPALIATTYTAPFVRTLPAVTYNARLTYPDYVGPMLYNYNGYPYMHYMNQIVI